MLIRIAVADDIPEMHRIRMSVRENQLLDPSAVQPADYLPMITSRGRGWVAVKDGRVIGFAIGDRAAQNVWALFVDPANEGAGAGRALHDEMMTWMFGEGLERVWLGTEPGTRAERFYRAAGWQLIGHYRGEAKYELTREAWACSTRA